MLGKQDFLNNESAIQKALKKTEGAASSGPGDAFIHSFSLTFSELAPLVLKSVENNEGPEAVESDLIKRVRSHNQNLDDFAHKMGFDSLSDMPEYQQALLGQSLSGIENYLREHVSETQIDSIIDSAQARLRKNPDIGVIVQYCGGSHYSEDVLVNLRLILIKPSLVFYYQLRRIGIHAAQIEQALESQQKIAIQMAKDVAFNQDKTAHVWDREKLFLSVLCDCMDAVAYNWIDLYCASSACTPLISDDPQYLAGRLTRFRSAIEEKDMGHSECIDQTIQRFSQGLSWYIDSPISKELERHHWMVIRAEWWRQIDELLAEGWSESANAIIEWFHSIDEQQQMQWFESEGQQPMPTGPVWHYIEKRIHHSSLAMDPERIPQEMLSRGSFYYLIYAWGIANSICDVRKTRKQQGA